MKKTNVITIRITADTHTKLKEEAREREWSVAYTANKLIEKGLIQNVINVSEENEKMF